MQTQTQKNKHSRDGCKAAGCNLKGHWTETDESGEIVFCFSARHRGEKHVQRFTLAELMTLFDGAKNFDLSAK